VGIVHGDQKRLPVGEVRAQPVERMRDGEAVAVAGGVARVSVEELASAPRRSREEVLAFAAARTCDPRLEKLERHPKRVLALEVRAARAERVHSSRLRLCDGQGQQRRLADPRLACDDHESTPLLARSIEDRAQRAGFFVSLEKHDRPRCHSGWETTRSRVTPAQEPSPGG
jgi:hypothetical protein